MYDTSVPVFIHYLKTLSALLKKAEDYCAAKKIDQGDGARVEISAIKFFGAKILHDVIDRAIQVHGARGVSGDTPLESMYRNARGARIYDGPDETHRMVVSRKVLQSFRAGNGWDFGIQ